VIFLDQDFNDMGYYSPFDGGAFHEETFSNFTFSCSTTNTSVVTVTNNTEFDYYLSTQQTTFTIDWGDSQALDYLIYPNITQSHNYTTNGVFTITIQMVAPWGITSVSHTVSIPCETGNNVNIDNPDITYSFIPPNGGPPVTMSGFSDYGPLDSGLSADDYITSNFVPTPITVTGITQSQLLSLKTYGTGSNDPNLGSGYYLNQVVPLGGQVELPNGNIEAALFGEIINADPTFTAYTISDQQTNSPITLFDYSNGVTLFETETVGLNEYNLFTQNCGEEEDPDPIDPQTCDYCLGIQGSTQVSQNLGAWDNTTTYTTGDLITFGNCCYYAQSQPPPAIPPNDISVFAIIWMPCPTQNCQPSQTPPPGQIYGCTDPAAMNYNPVATIDNGSCYFLGGGVTVGTDPGGSNTGGPFIGVPSTASTATGPECCDAAAMNYNSTLCNDPNWLGYSSPSTCVYSSGANPEIWVCDPDNDLRLRAVANSSGDPWAGATSNCNTANKYHPPQAQQKMPGNNNNYGFHECTPAATSYDQTPNPAANSVTGQVPDTPLQVNIQNCIDNGVAPIPSSPSLQNADIYNNDTEGSPRGSGCVRIDNAWFKPASGVWNTTTNLALAQFVNTTFGSQFYSRGPVVINGIAMSWENATIQTGLLLATWPPINGQSAAPPGLYPLCVNNTTPCSFANNTGNPTVSLLELQANNNTTAAPHTWSSWCGCINANSNAGTNDGCKSNVSNYTF
jgi:hypothetical protein